MKNIERVVFFVVVVGLVFWLFHFREEVRVARTSSIYSDSLFVDGQGQYRKMVNNFNQNEDTLKAQIAARDQTVADGIVKNKETVLAYERYILTLDTKEDTTGLKTDTIYIDSTKVLQKSFIVHYPDSLDWFVSLSGKIIGSQLAHKFSWQPLDISLILTEKKDGTWQKRLIGPEWLKLNSMEVNSLPPKEYYKPPNHWIGGASFYQHYQGHKSVILRGGRSFGKFDALLEVGTDQIGIGFNYHFIPLN